MTEIVVAVCFVLFRLIPFVCLWACFLWIILLGRIERIIRLVLVHLYEAWAANIRRPARIAQCHQSGGIQ
jgi:hypothetical protein